MDFTQRQKYEILAEELKKEGGLERVIKTPFGEILPRPIAYHKQRLPASVYAESR